MKELIGLLGDLVPEGKTVICLDNETRARLDEIYEEMNELLISADEINAERGMSTVAMGFSPYYIERIQNGSLV
ncbi:MULTISPECIES: hypothetical protein [Priestia]|jgi:hypothetical protein|uniref:hypothetical protein n=1 Tax=Priestia TaxID=2800373 RepID=UPI0018A33A3E|nr:MULTISPECIES: hypothetical protein [Priestia]QTL51183.1 hypothetical protein J5Z55_08910 [Priestia aryabhattai]USL44154.1 hypothetical protein LIS78_08900 [Priestia megaterium]